MKLTAQAVHFHSPAYKQATKLLKAVFPKKERIAAFPLLIGTLRKSIHFTAFYDSGDFVGLMYSIENEKYFFILYLAVEPQLQSKGYGKMMLDYAYSQAGMRSIILNTEPPDDSADNPTQRKRRLAFYQRNGLSPTGYGFSSGGIAYIVLSSDTTSFDAVKCGKLFCGVSLHRQTSE